MDNLKIVLADCGSGLLITVLGAFAAATVPVGRTWWVVLATALVTGVATYVDEQRLSGASVRRRLAVYGLAVVAVFGLMGGVLMTTTLAAGTVLVTAVVGFGIATIVNRLVFGVVYPVPERRVIRAERYSM